MWGFFATGDLFEFRDRTIAAAIGAEFREDTIASQNDIGGVLALNAAESPLQEGETIGSRDVTEFFAEINIPILDNLDFDGAVRFTDESNFGNETTWRARAAWEPTDYLTFSATHGTSYRAPNLREQFLADQFGGIGGLGDPCNNANIQQMVTDSGDSDPDTVLVINNCTADGIVFTDTDANGFPDTTPLGSTGTTTIPVRTGGNNTLLPETSETNTFTVKFSQPWTDAYDLDIGLSYFDIVIEDTVAQPEASFIMNGCYGDPTFPNLDSPFCNLITRLGAGVNPQANFINQVDVSFINIGEETARGLDLNTRLNFSLLETGIDISWSTVATKLLEREIETFEPADRDDNLGEIGFPEYKFTSTLGVFIKDFEILMQNRYIGDGQEDDTDVLTPGAGRFSADGMGSRDLDFIDGIWYTDMSVTYGQDTWAATLGISNLFDEDPPLIHSFEGPNRNNAVSSQGYDFYGQTWYFNATVSF